MILPVYVEPQEILRTSAEIIPEVTPELRELAFSMRETMHNAHGIGLAAPQVGRSINMFIAEYVDDEEPADGIPFTAMINPQILWRSTLKSVIEEGCLSIPGVYGNVKRPRKVTVKFTDLEGKQKEITADHLFARVIQHEIDHLKGVLFTDYVNPDKRVFREPPPYPQA
ncbi:MAG TPA: peptide deformylase [Verrucomicrobiae bacterium]|nr:peptide deformylase [Verrucomicrobiae bacterium]